MNEAERLKGQRGRRKGGRMEVEVEGKMEVDNEEGKGVKVERKTREIERIRIEEDMNRTRITKIYKCTRKIRIYKQIFT